MQNPEKKRREKKEREVDIILGRASNGMKKTEDRLKYIKVRVKNLLLRKLLRLPLKKLLRLLKMLLQEKVKKIKAKKMTGWA
ncbi:MULTISPECIES: hypothetical protein [Candidatus Ichthyocystis]|uniref:hypothetical protein n=1 Tax=Candidatus Ichthyocystis TaxID=2929841 RepID=UPI000B874BCC|nr:MULTISPECIES: hypothetical protein [Ichthyocystis]